MDVPGFTRDERRNPHWKVPTLVPVERMDNSMAMTMAVGNISIKGDKGKKPKLIGDVSLAIGGFVFIVAVHDEKNGDRRYAINLFDFINDLLNTGDPVMRGVPKLPAPPLRKTQPGPKKRAKRK